MEAKYLLLATVLMTSMVTSYGITCYVGASLGSIEAATTSSNCTECGSESFSALGFTSRTYTCYPEGFTCTSGCCSTDLCNSASEVAPWLIGSCLMTLLGYVIV